MLNAPVLLAFLAAALASGCSRAEGAATQPKRLDVEVLRSWEHDRGVYTQGLIWDGGELVESSGRYGRSSVRRWAIGESEPRITRSLDRRYFAEGLARAGDRLLLLTWRENEALVLDPETLEQRGRHVFEGEGWGLCFDGRHLLMSDGTSHLTRRDADTFDVIERFQVTLAGDPVDGLNELEFAEGWIYANVFQSDLILQIDPHSGQTVAAIDASGLLSASQRREADVLNGIAYDPSTETFFVTGKLWPKIFQVRFVER